MAAGDEENEGSINSPLTFGIHSTGRYALWSDSNDSSRTL